MSAHFPVLIVIIPMIAALAVPLSCLLSTRLPRVLVLVSLVLDVFVAIRSLQLALSVGEARYHLAGWPPPWGIEIVLDPLSGTMAALVAVVALLVAFYSGPYLRNASVLRQGTFYSLYLLLVSGLLGIVVTGDLFNLYVFLEISSIAAYALLSSGGSRAVVATFRYLIVGTIAGSFYLLGIGYLYAVTGTLNMTDVSTRIGPVADSPVLAVAIAFIVVALAIKSALFPLHGWLPDTYTYATGPVVGFVSAVMAKVSAYALFRILYFIFGASGIAGEALRLLGWASVLAIVAGSLLALVQKDVRRMLAYSSISQMGYIIMGFAIGTPLALTGAILHILNHAVMKGCLFLSVNGVHWQTGVFRIRDYTGMARRLPITMAAFTVAALSMIGLPPTAGFFSKYYLVLGALQAHDWVSIAALALSSLLSSVYFFRVLENAYLRRGDEKRYQEVPVPMVVPVVVLAAAVLVMGVFSQTIVTRIVTASLPG